MDSQRRRAASASQNAKLFCKMSFGKVQHTDAELIPPAISSTENERSF